MLRPASPAQRLAALLALPTLGAAVLLSSGTVPNEIQQPGTQPLEAGGMEAVSKCDNCHGGYDPAVAPADTWRGSPMAHAGRDPLFWATLAVAEQDFGGSGDLCLRCHAPVGWLEGRSTPTDGSGLASSDEDGVECDLCHKLADPDGSEWPGVQNPPFLAHDEEPAPTGYYGSGMMVLYDGSEKLGPYDVTVARHDFGQSSFHRSSELCATCHDVSNPLVGDLAHNNGAQQPLEPGSFSGVLGDPVDTKAAFNNFPYQYGIVERTSSEHAAGLLAQTPVADYPMLPAELQGGALLAAYDAALLAGTGGNFEDGSLRVFSCQSCHMRPTVGEGCDKNDAPLRGDLALHDLTGGNSSLADLILHLDGQDKLVLGGGLSSDQEADLIEGSLRAEQNLRDAAALEVEGDRVRVINRTGHKLITGYPEGRRMWLNVRWYDDQGLLLREDGAYDWITVDLDGATQSVRSLVDPHDPELHLYQAVYGLTQEWATQLLGLGLDPAMALAYDRVTGAVELTLGDLAAMPPDTAHESFHFVLNNEVLEDNRIPPYGMSYDLARERNVLPVPEDQYGAPGPGGSYEHWDELFLSPPAGAVTAEIELLYQPTSWEYIQFLHLANDGSVPFLASTGADLLDAWLATGMAEPVTMASATWTGGPPLPGVRVVALDTWQAGATSGFLATPGVRTDVFFPGEPVVVRASVADESDTALSGAVVVVEFRDAQDQLLATGQGVSDSLGTAAVTWADTAAQAPGSYAAEVVDVVLPGYAFAPQSSVTFVDFRFQ